jgi:hypothetical protein
MRKAVVLITLGLLVLSGTVRADDTLWSRRRVGSSASGTAVASIGTDIYTAGGVNTPNPNILIVKYRGNGDSVWSRVLNFDSTEKTVDVAVGSDSTPVVAVAVTNPLPPKLSLVKLSKNGDTVWTRHRANFAPTGIALNAQNEIFVYGSSGGLLANDSLALLKYSAAGALVINHHWRLGTNFTVGGCAVDPNGNLVGAVTVNGLAAIFKFDGLGDTSWSQRYLDLTGSELQGVAVAPNGCIVLAAKFNTSLRVAKFEPSGSELWSYPLPGLGSSQVYANIAVDADSNVAVPLDSLVYVVDAQGAQKGLLNCRTAGQLRSVAFGYDGLPVAAGNAAAPPGCLTVKFTTVTAIAEPANPPAPGAGRFLVEGVLGPGQAIVLTVPRAGSYTISIMSENGALLRRISQGYLLPGEFRLSPGKLAAGSYYLRIAGPAGTVREKFIQLR